MLPDFRFVCFGVLRFVFMGRLEGEARAQDHGDTKRWGLGSSAIGL